MAGRSEQGGALRSKSCQPLNDRSGITLVTLFGTLERCLEEALAHAPVLEPRMGRLLRGVLEWQHPATFEIACPGGFGRSRDFGLGETCQLGSVFDDERPVAAGQEQALRELGGELRLLLVESSEPFLGGVVE